MSLSSGAQAHSGQVEEVTALRKCRICFQVERMVPDAGRAPAEAGEADRGRPARRPAACQMSPPKEEPRWWRGGGLFSALLPCDQPQKDPPAGEAEQSSPPDNARGEACCEEEESFISPCKCSGSMAWVHRSCLQVWRQSSPRRDSFYQCEQCFTMYTFKTSRLASLLSLPLTTRLATAVVVKAALIFTIIFTNMTLNGAHYGAPQYYTSYASAPYAYGSCHGGGEGNHSAQWPHPYGRGPSTAGLFAPDGVFMAVFTDDYGRQASLQSASGTRITDSVMRGRRGVVRGPHGVQSTRTMCTEEAAREDGRHGPRAGPSYTIAARAADAIPAAANAPPAGGKAWRAFLPSSNSASLIDELFDPTFWEVVPIALAMISTLALVAEGTHTACLLAVLLAVSMAGTYLAEWRWTTYLFPMPIIYGTYRFVQYTEATVAALLNVVMILTASDLENYQGGS